MIGYDIDIAVISETHMKKRHADSCVSISGYTLFRRDRVRRNAGGVAVYVRNTLPAVEWLPTPLIDSIYELLWVQVSHAHDLAFVCALYHPPSPLYKTPDILMYIESTVL